jgi:DNA mismatch repair ATPase MutL
MNANKGRIRALPSGVANNVRASHVIGSQQRGVEELLQNSIIHGEAKKVIVTLGNDNIIIVEDDGVGIDNESMRTLIGTEACTNNASLEIFGSQGRGESLRCVAALCVEVTIESTFLSNNRSVVSSTKLIRNGVTVSFEDSTDHKMSSSILPMMRSSIKTTQGTRIILRNFFQQFAVRRNHRTENLLSHVRSMLTMMSLIYPLVSFQLINGAGEVDVLLDAPLSAEEFSGALTCRVPHQLGTSSATLEDEADALVDRMNKINSTSSDEDLGRTIKLAGEGGNVRAFGVIILRDEDAICRGGRKMQFAVNGRPAAQAKQLTEFVQERIKKHFGRGSACE